MMNEEMKNALVNALGGLSTAYEHTKKMDSERESIRKFIKDTYQDYLDVKEMVLNIVNDNADMLKSAMTWNERSGYPFHGICYDRFFRFGGVEVVFGPVDGVGFDGHCDVDSKHGDHNAMFPKATSIRFTLEESNQTRNDCTFKADLLNNYNTAYLPIRDIIEDTKMGRNANLETLLIVRKYAEQTAIRTKYLYDEVLNGINKAAENYRKMVTNGIMLAGEKYVKVA